MIKQSINYLQAQLQAFRDATARFRHYTYHRWHLPTQRFVQVNIETNRVCNRACHFCLYGVREKVPAQPMPAALLFRIVDQLAEMGFVGRLSLFSTNEALTDKRIDQFTRYSTLVLPNAWHTLVSNGDLLTPERLDNLFNSGLDLLMLNAYDEDAVARHENLHTYAASRYPNKLLCNNRTLYTDWVSRAGHIPAFMRAPVQGFCDLPFYALYINSLGHVLACCHDFDEVNLVGDCTTQTLEEIWYGAPFERLRKHLRQGNRHFSALCAQCDRPADFAQYQWSLQQPAAYGKGYPSRRICTGAQKAEADDIKAALLAREARKQTRTV